MSRNSTWSDIWSLTNPLDDIAKGRISITVCLCLWHMLSKRRIDKRSKVGFLMKFIDGLQTRFVLSYLVRAERLSFLSPKTNIWPCWLSCPSLRTAGQQVSVKSLENITLGSAEGQNQLNIWYPCVMSSLSLPFNMVCAVQQM